MRFGFKTSPQDTTWGAVLEVWRAADDIEVFESGWTSDHFYHVAYRRPVRPAPRGLDHDRFEEACEVLTGLLSRQQTTTFQGRHDELTAARCKPKPVQQPHPPIWIGGNGEKRTLRTAARFAQYWSFDGESAEQFSRARDVLHQHCADLGGTQPRSCCAARCGSPVIRRRRRQQRRLSVRKASTS